MISVGEFLDRAIGVFSPTWGLTRIAARATMAQIESFGGGTGKGGYEAGKLNRLTKGRTGSRVKENAIPALEVQRLRWQAWDLWRNNGYAKKIVRSITSKVIGKGMVPTSQAKTADGEAHSEFRQRATELWEALQTNFDFRGKPGQGGLDTLGLAKLMLRSVVVGGETLFQLVPIEKEDQESRDLPIPFVLQLIDSDRLTTEQTLFITPAALPEGHHIYRGIELDSRGRRVAYHLYDYPIGAVAPIVTEPKVIPAKDMVHLFVEDDIDQMRGVSWFASALLDIRDVGDYRFNELKSSAMAACVVLGYTRPTGSPALGLNQPATADLTDDDGNKISAIQPGMFVNLGKDGKLEGFNPQRNGANVEGFSQFMLRGIAGGLPGIKSSTITGDYRNSSFSSERSADNDVWPEMEDVQDWFAASAMQPLWEKIVDAAVVAGFFDGVITVDEYMADRKNFHRATWQGPVARSINPTDDAKSAGMRVAGLLSPLQHEAAALGSDWRENVRAMAEVYAYAAEVGAPKNAIDHLFGVNVTEQIQESTLGGDASDTEGVQAAQADDAAQAADAATAIDSSGGTKKGKKNESKKQAA